MLQLLMCGELGCIPQFYLSFFRMSQCLPIPYSLFTSDIKLLSFIDLKIKNPCINSVRWLDMEFKSYWHLNILNLWTAGPYGLRNVRDWQREGEDLLSLCTLLVTGTDWKFPLRLRVLLLWAVHVVIMTSPKPNLSLELCCCISFLAAGQTWV